MTGSEPKIPLLSSLPADAQAQLLPLFRSRELERDEYVFFEGDPAEFLYVVGEGKVKILKHSDTGKDLILQVLSAGDSYGTVDILDGKEYTVSAQTMEPALVWSMHRTDYLDMLNRHPALGLEIVRCLSRQLKDAYGTMQSLAVERVERRIARILLKLAAATGQQTDRGIVIGSPLTRQDIADMTGTTVETAIRVMSRFTKSGIIRSERRQIVLLEPHQLVLIAEEV